VITQKTVTLPLEMCWKTILLEKNSTSFRWGTVSNLVIETITLTFGIDNRSLTINVFCTRYFVVALREKEWDQAYLSIYNQLKPGGYFQVVEPGTRVRKATVKYWMKCYAQKARYNVAKRSTRYSWSILSLYYRWIPPTLNWTRSMLLVRLGSVLTV
jgi:hypothetical protein